MLFSDDCIRNDKTTHRQDYCSSSPQIVSSGRQFKGGIGDFFVQFVRGLLFTQKW